MLSSTKAHSLALLTNISFFDGWRVINTITSYSNYIALALTSLNNQQFLVRNRASKDDVLMVEYHVVKFYERHVREVSTVNDDR